MSIGEKNEPNVQYRSIVAIRLSIYTSYGVPLDLSYFIVEVNILHRDPSAYRHLENLYTMWYIDESLFEKFHTKTSIFFRVYYNAWNWFGYHLSVPYNLVSKRKLRDWTKVKKNLLVRCKVYTFYITRHREFAIHISWDNNKCVVSRSNNAEYICDRRLFSLHYFSYKPAESIFFAGILMLCLLIVFISCEYDFCIIKCKI